MTSETDSESPVTLIHLFSTNRIVLLRSKVSVKINFTCVKNADGKEELKNLRFSHSHNAVEER